MSVVKKVFEILGPMMPCSTTGPEGRLSANPNGVRAINHSGVHYKVNGPASACRARRRAGQCLVPKPSSSDTGKRFAARHAEAVFTAHLEKATAKAFYIELKALVAEVGRKPADVIVLPGFSPIIGSTEAEARRFSRRRLNELSDPEVGRNPHVAAFRPDTTLAFAA